MGCPLATGLEVALGKAALTGASRSLGVSRRFFRLRGAAKRTRKALQEGAMPSDFTSFLSDLTPEIAQQLEAFAQSPEVEHIAYCVATSLLIAKTGRKTDKHIAQLKSQLTDSLRLATSLHSDQIEVAGALIFGAISSEV